VQHSTHRYDLVHFDIILLHCIFSLRLIEAFMQIPTASISLDFIDFIDLYRFFQDVHSCLPVRRIFSYISLVLGF
jgi:hypothetical protein